jgi:hypothetical protein
MAKPASAVPASEPPEDSPPVSDATKAAPAQLRQQATSALT